MTAGPSRPDPETEAGLRTMLERLGDPADIATGFRLRGRDAAVPSTTPS